MVRAGLAAVANELESANHLAHGEEAEALSGDDTTNGELSGADIPGLLDEGLGGLEDGPVPNRVEQVLVVGLEGGDGTEDASLVPCPRTSSASLLGSLLTGGSSSGSGKCTCRPPGRPWSSR